jgi:hypothetical protein
MKIRASRLIAIKIGNTYMTYQDVIEKFNKSFKNDDTLRIFNNTSHNLERNHIITFLLQKGYSRWSDFVRYIKSQKEEIRKSFEENGSTGLIIYKGKSYQKKFVYLGCKQIKIQETAKINRYGKLHYYKHLDCGGCVKEEHLHKENDKIRPIYCCQKCCSIFTEVDITADTRMYIPILL